jgi:CRP-like cAMP-binding protein
MACLPRSRPHRVLADESPAVWLAGSRWLLAASRQAGTPEAVGSFSGALVHGCLALDCLSRLTVVIAPQVFLSQALLAAEGVANSEIAERLGVSRPTVIAWRKRYAREGLTGQLGDRPRPGRPRPCAAIGAPRSWPLR